jgi:hypothetical protein
MNNYIGPCNVSVRFQATVLISVPCDSCMCWTKMTSFSVLPNQ